jgi:archaemetzincin
MKPALLILIFLVFISTGCRHEEILTFANNNQNQIIALQPLDGFNVNNISSVVNEINRFYNKKIIVLKPINIPVTYVDKRVGMYSADSIISDLSKMQKENIAEIIGLTHEPLFTIKYKKQYNYDDKILGLGYQPGITCVISDGNIGKKDTALFNRRLRNVIFHEIGHNMGLSHCEDPNCFMSENNDNADDYCKRCKRKLMR